MKDLLFPTFFWSADPPNPASTYCIGYKGRSYGSTNLPGTYTEIATNGDYAYIYWWYNPHTKQQETHIGSYLEMSRFLVYFLNRFEIVIG